MNSIFLFSEDHSPIKEVHFNLWMVGDDKFIDIGIKIEKEQKLILFLPWENACIEDLYERIIDKDILNAIFNQHLKIVPAVSDSYLTVSRNSEKFDVVKADFEKEKKEIKNTTHNNKYTQIKIKANPLAENIDIAYVRLRAKGFKNDVFNKEYHEAGYGFIPYNEIVEVIDFRVNELRTVKQSDLEKIGIFKAPKIEILHFFLLKSFREINSLASPSYDRCRELEDKAWDKYLSLRNINKEAKLAYHWKKNKIEEGQHFSILATFSKKNVSLKIIGIYILAFIFLNYFSTFTYGLIRSVFCE